jgi:hypothetical protein
MAQATKIKTESVAVSQSVANKLYASGTFGLYKEILKDLSIDESKLSDVAMFVVRGLKAGLKTLPALFEKELALEKTQAEQLAYKIATQVLFEVKEEIPGFIEVVKAWGGDVKKMQGGEPQTMEPKEFVQTVLSEMVGKGDDHLNQRMAHLLEEYVTSKKDAANILSTMIKTSKVGGLGFDEKAAKELLAFVDKKKVGVVFGKRKKVMDIKPPVKKAEITKQPEPIQKKKRLSREERLIKVEPEVKIEEPVVKVKVPIPVVKKEVKRPERKDRLKKEPVEKKEKKKKPEPKVEPKLDAFSDKDLEEVKKIKKEKKDVIKARRSTPKTIKQMVDEVCKSPHLKLEDPLLMGRCKKVVETRIRNVRTAHQTRNQIEQAIEQGGLGISGRALAGMLEAIEAYVTEYENLLEAQSLEAKEKHVQKRVDSKNKKDQVDQKQEEMLSKRYASITGKAPKESVKPVAPNGARVSAGVTHEEAVNLQKRRIDNDRVDSANKKANKNKQQAQVKPVLQKPTVQDVQSKKRLAGPIEELKYMTLSDFRRLSADPAKAMTKILDKVDLVLDQGYQKKVEAIKAWQVSKVNQIYVSLAQRSILEGTALEELRAASAKENKTTMLTKEELAVIIKLNTELRF